MLLWEERFLVLLQPVFGERLLGTFPLGMSSVTWDMFLIYEVLKDHSGVFWLYFVFLHVLTDWAYPVPSCKDSTNEVLVLLVRGSECSSSDRCPKPISCQPRFQHAVFRGHFIFKPQQSSSGESFNGQSCRTVITTGEARC